MHLDVSISMWSWARVSAFAGQTSTHFLHLLHFSFINSGAFLLSAIFLSKNLVKNGRRRELMRPRFFFSTHLKSLMTSLCASRRVYSASVEPFSSLSAYLSIGMSLGSYPISTASALSKARAEEEAKRSPVCLRVPFAGPAPSIEIIPSITEYSGTWTL